MKKLFSSLAWALVIVVLLFWLDHQWLPFLGKLIKTLEDNKQLLEKTRKYNWGKRETFSFTTSEGVKLDGWMKQKSVMRNVWTTRIKKRRRLSPTTTARSRRRRQSPALFYPRRPDVPHYALLLHPAVQFHTFGSGERESLALAPIILPGLFEQLLVVFQCLDELTEKRQPLVVQPKKQDHDHECPRE
jgi:hypothetical protein